MRMDSRELPGSVLLNVGVLWVLLGLIGLKEEP